MIGMLASSSSTPFGSRVPAFGQYRVVVAHPENPARSPDVRPGRKLLQCVNQTVDRFDASIRRCEQIGADSLRTEPDKLSMPVDEARDHGTLGNIDDLGFNATPRHDLGLRPNRNNSAVPDGNRLGARVRIINGHDSAARDDLVRESYLCAISTVSFGGTGG